MLCTFSELPNVLQDDVFRLACNECRNSRGSEPLALVRLWRYNVTLHTDDDSNGFLSVDIFTPKVA